MATPEQVQEQINQALEAERTARAATVSVKLPQFWPEKTRLWFAQADAQFDIKGITVEKTKYSYVVSMLDDKTAEHVMDIIETPPAANPYTTLKERLTKAYAISDSEKAARILDMNGLGDKTPTQCLNSMLLLIPQGQEPGFLFREVFLRQLPVEIRTQLAQTTKTGTTPAALRELAAEADKYFASTGSRISAISNNNSGASLPMLNPSGDRESNLSADASSTEADVFAVSTRGGRGRGRGRGGQRSNDARQSTPRTLTVCYYHHQYGDKAVKCAPPCDFKTGNSQSGRRPTN